VSNCKEVLNRARKRKTSPFKDLGGFEWGENATKARPKQKEK